MSAVGTLTYNRLTTQPPTWTIKAQPHVITVAKRVLTRGRPDRVGQLVITHTPDVARDIEWLRDRYPLDMNERTAAFLAESVAGWTERQHVVDQILGGHPGAPGLRAPVRAPREYQTQFLTLLRAVRRVLLADAWGLGKTFSAQLVLGEENALPALMVTLTDLPAQWLRELEKDWPDLTGHIITSGTPYDLRNARGMNGHYPDVLLINYAKLAGWAPALAGQVKTVVFDEAQELRTGVATLKGAAAAHIASLAEYVVGLSASPVYNYGDEIWRILDIIDPGMLGTWDEFKREYCNSGSGTKVKVADPAALGTYLRSGGRFLRRTRADVHRELPDPITVRHVVEADPAKIRELAGDTQKIARLILSDTGEGSDRFRAAGELDWRLRQATGVAKAPYVGAFVRLLLESEPRVMIFAWHRAVYDVLLAELAEFEPVMYTGSETATQKRDSWARFCGGPARVMLMSLRAGAGLDGLQDHCSAAVFAELDWSQEVLNQCVGRLNRDRAGQRETVAAFYLVAEEGSDPVVEDVLGLKRAQSEGILDPNRPLFAPVELVNRAELLARAVLGGHPAPPAGTRVGGRGD